jgi:hypothetical protein
MEVALLYTNYKNNKEDKLLVFLSDGTGLSSESMGLALINQFKGYEGALCENLPYIDNHEKIQEVILVINKWAEDFNEVIVFSTFSNPEYTKIFKDSLKCSYFDIFSYLLPQISQQINKPITPFDGISRRRNKKDERAVAIDYALEFDDGQKLDFDEADIIILGLSRSGKTPTALWLALHYGLKAANYPITEDDFDKYALPESIIKNLSKCVLLVPSLQRLNQLREERFKNSKYASLENCKKELKQLEGLKHISAIPRIDVSNKSIEEIATQALMLRNVHPKGRF